MGHKNSKKPNYKELSKGTNFTTQELKAWFDKFKKGYPKGNINRQEFIALYKKMFGAGNDADEFCNLVFEKYDADNNGFIDFREFVTTLSVVAKGTIDEKLVWAFNLYDADGNNYLTQSEIIVVLETIYKAKNQPDPRMLAETTAKEIFNDADDNKDDRLSLDEFVKHATSSKAIKDMLQCL